MTTTTSTTPPPSTASPSPERATASSSLTGRVVKKFSSTSSFIPPLKENVFDEVVTLEDVLFDTREFPLTRARFENFLRKEYCSENYEFWSAAQQFREGALNETDVWRGEKRRAFVKIELSRDDDLKSLAGEQLALVDEEVSSARAWAKRIVEDYVGERAKKIQVNLSQAMADEVMTAVQNNGIPDFKPAQREMKQMMHDTFARFLNKVYTQNMEDALVRQRLVLGTIFLALSWTLGLLLRYLAVPAIPRYAVSLLVVVPFFSSAFYLSSGLSKNCPILAARGVSEVQEGIEVRVCELLDPIARRKSFMQSLLVWISVIIFGCGFAAIVAALP